MELIVTLPRPLDFSKVNFVCYQIELCVVYLPECLIIGASVLTPCCNRDEMRV